MVFQIDPDLPSELVPLSWLIGDWRGEGYLGYPDVPERRFAQEVEFSHHGHPWLEYTARSWLLDDTGARGAELTCETGFWQLARPRVDADAGPALVPPVGDPALTNADEVEALRNDRGGFDLEVGMVHPGGVLELYLGSIKGPRIELATDVVARSRTAKPYTSAQRMYGLVGGRLLWAWDIAALGQDLQSHASAQLDRVG